MSDKYTEIPENYCDAEAFLVTDLEQIVQEIIVSRKIFFYDTCSYRRHANLSVEGMNRIAAYYKKHDSILIITRCILMELASSSGVINEEYISYLKLIVNAGIKVILLDEENVFDILAECFSTNAKVNEYLTWAVRMSRLTVSTITETLKSDIKLYEEVIEGKNSRKPDIYRRFFSSVRKNKEHDDNLGEEIIGICVHILSHLPGIEDGKLCVITDDKGAAGNLSDLYRRTNNQFKGAKVVIFSTPKMVQHMHHEGIELTEEEIIEILSQGTSGNIVVMGTTPYDLVVNPSISLSCKDLAKKIMAPNEINIVF